MKLSQLFSSKYLVMIAILVAALTFDDYFTRNHYFFQDDLLFLKQGEDQSLSISYLREPVFQHFSPTYRFLDKVLLYLAGPNYHFARVIEMTLLVITILAFYFALKPLVSVIFNLTATLLFSQSLALTHLLGWWTAMANITPDIFFTLLTIGCFFRFEISKKRIWALLSFLFFFCSLLSYEMSWLTPGFLLLLSAVAFSSDLRLSNLIKFIRSNIYYWMAVYIFLFLAMLNYMKYYYATVHPVATFSQMLKYFYYQLFYYFFPSLFGVRPLVSINVGAEFAYYGPKSLSTAAVLISVIIFLVVVLLSSLRNLKCYLLWAVFGICYLINSIVIGINRVGVFGIGFGLNTDYLVTPTILFFIVLALCVYVRKENSYQKNNKPNLYWLKSKRIKIMLIVCLIVLFEICLFFSTSLQYSKDFEFNEAYATKEYLFKLKHNLNKLNHLQLNYSLLNDQVPSYVVSPVFIGYNELSTVLQTLKINTTFNELRKYVFAVDQQGDLVAEQYVTIAKVQASKCFKKDDELAFGAQVLENAPNNLWLSVNTKIKANGLHVEIKGFNSNLKPVYLQDLSIPQSNYPILINITQGGIKQINVSFYSQNISGCVTRLSLGYFIPSNNLQKQHKTIY